MIRHLKLAVARRVNFSIAKRLNGRRFRVPVLGGIGARLRGDYEPWMLATLIELEPRVSGAFVDVGVNIGQTLLAVKSVRPDWPYLGFEPNPVCVFYLNRLIEENALEDCAIYPVGIGESTGVAELRLANLSGGEGTVIPGIRPNSHFSQSIKVPILGPDALPAELMAGPIGVLKVDVEDAELEVFRAVLPLLERDHPVILTELLPFGHAQSAGMRLRRERQEALLGLLLGLGYRAFRLHLDRHREPIDELTPHSELAWTNYLLVSEDDRDLLAWATGEDHDPR